MWSALNELFGKSKRVGVFKSNEAAAKWMENFYHYYSDFQKKLELFNDLKKLLVEIKAEIYDFQIKQSQDINESRVKELQKQLNDGLSALNTELQKIKALIRTESKEEETEKRYSCNLLEFTIQELEKEEEYKSKRFWLSYKELLQKMRTFLQGTTKSQYGIVHILVSQLQLLEDIGTARKEIASEMRMYSIGI